MGTDRTIAIVTPAPPRSRSGNRVTALRWTLLLRQLGCRPFLTSEWSGRPAQALLAVHAQKSAASVDAFLRRYPERKVGVLLAGTDLYPEFRPDAQMSRCLEQATILISLQAAAASSLPPTLRDRVRVVVQSARSGPGALLTSSAVTARTRTPLFAARRSWAPRRQRVPTGINALIKTNGIYYDYILLVVNTIIDTNIAS